MKQLSEILADVKKDARENIIGKNPEVIQSGLGESLDLDSAYITAKKWHKIDDVVAVWADLRGSSQLTHHFPNAQTVAGIYEGATGTLTSIYQDIGSDYLQVQGDGVLAIFFGDKRYERAVCAAITIKTMSSVIADLISTKSQGTILKSGYKIGVSSSSILVKKMGTERRANHQALVWAGNAVNYAVKASEEDKSLVITRSVWEAIKNNDYLTISCGCKNSFLNHSALWENIKISKILKATEKYGKSLATDWCVNCGNTFMNEILNGPKVNERSGDSVRNVRADIRNKDEYEVALRKRGLEDIGLGH